MWEGCASQGGSYNSLRFSFVPTISTLKIPAIKDTACIPGFRSAGTRVEVSKLVVVGIGGLGQS